MNDEQLIQLAQQKTPEELTLDEVRTLRDRLGQSAELRQELLERLELEPYLAAALARVDTSLDAVLLRAEQTRRDARSGLLFSVLGAVIVLVLAAVVAVMVSRTTHPPVNEAGEDVAAVVESDGEEQDRNETSENGGPGESQATAGPAESSQDAEDAAGAPRDPPASDSAVSVEPPEQGGPAPLDPAVANTPWGIPLSRPPRPFDQVWLSPFGPDEGPLSREDLRKWFAPVPGVAHRIHETRRNDIHYGVLEGVLRLQAPLPQMVVWKMAVVHSERLAFHFYHGEQGVSFQWHKNNHGTWAAYTTRREPGKPLPTSVFLTATDDSRANRSETYYANTILLWYADGEIVLSLGDVELLRAPLAGPPTDVYFEGKAHFDGMALVPTSGLPPAPPELPVVAEIDQPTELDWITHLPEGARFEQCEDGAVQLHFDKPKGSGWIAARLPHDGLGVVDVLIEDATFGTSVFLGAGERPGEGGKLLPNGTPESVVGVMRNQHSKRINLHERLVGDWGIGEHWFQFKQHGERCVEPPFYVRLLASPGRIRYWISQDGIHWAGAFPLHPKGVTNLQYVGIGFGNGLDQPGHIKLRKIVQREFTELPLLAPPDVLRRAPSLADAGDMSAWLVAVTEAKPADVELRVWRRACALQTLADGCRSQLGHRLLSCLLDESVDLVPRKRQPALLDEAALLTATWTSDPTYKQHLLDLLDRYRRLAVQDGLENEPAPSFSELRHRMMAAPISTELREKVLDGDLVRGEIVRRVYRQDWSGLDRLIRDLRFFAGSQEYLKQLAPLAEWAQALSARHLPGGGHDGAAALKGSWRAPVVEELSKEAFNVHAELSVALASDSPRDACRVIANMTPQCCVGLVPSPSDPDLFVSLPAAIRTAMEARPELQAMMIAEFASVASVRLQRATTENDASQVELIPVQYFGTPAAAQAHQWLGDRALSGGEFGTALAHYGLAAGTSPDSTDTHLQARMRLAASMVGDEFGSPVSEAVHIGELVIPADEFERLVAEMRSTHNARFTPAATGPTRIAGQGTAPQPTAYKFQEKAKFEAYVGANPSGGPSGMTNREIHWLDRQLAFAAADDLLFVNTRFQVVALDLRSGQRKWVSPPVPNNKANVLHWPLIAMRPIVSADRVFARQLATDGPALVCLDRNNGQHRWWYQSTREELVFSDPFAVRGQLFALTLRQGTSGEDLVQLSRFDPEGGQVLEQRPVAKLKETWEKFRTCQVTAADDGLFVVLGGAVLSIDYEGRVRWLRRQTLLPADEDRAWIHQDFQPPLIHDGRLYVVSPGVRTIDCIEPTTGALVWRRVLPQIERLMGTAAGWLIVQTQGAIQAIDPGDGSTVWSHEIVDPLVAQLCGPQIVYSRRIVWVPAKNLRAPQLVWLDAKTGRELATHCVQEMEHDWPRFSALIRTEDRLWGIFGRGEERDRLFAELTPEGDALESAPLEASDRWSSHILEKLQQAARKVLPEWQVLSGDETGHTGLLSEVQGEKEVLGIGPSPSVPVVFAREVEIPALGRPRLKMRVAGSHGRKWRVEIGFRGETVFSQDLPEGNNWANIDADLSMLSGRQGILTVRGRLVDGDYPANIYWKSLELVY